MATINKIEYNNTLYSVEDSDAQERLTALENASNQVKILGNIIFPVGSLYLANSSSISPETIFGGTWQQVSQGYLLGGQGTGLDSNNSNRTFNQGANTGYYKHTLSVSELPAHNHNTTNSTSDGTVTTSSENKHTHTGTTGGMSGNSGYGFNRAGGGYYGGGTASGNINQVSIAHTHSFTTGAGSSHSHTVSLKATGGGQSFDINPPTYGIYVWERQTLASV